MTAVPDSPLHVQVSWDGTVVTVTVSGKLDFTNGPGLAESLLKLAVDRPTQLLLDLGDLAVIDDECVAAFGRTLQALRQACPVSLRRPPPWTLQLPTGSFPGKPEAGDPAQ